MRKFLRRVRYLWQRERLERDLQIELESHRQQMAEDRRPAFASSLRVQEEVRDVWGWGWLDALRQDLVYAARQLRRHAGFTAAAVVVLALGVGLNLAVFHVVRAVYSDRVPVPNADALMRVVRQSPDGERWSFPGDVAAAYDGAELFTAVVGERFGALPVRVEDDDGEAASARFVSGNYFQALGVEAEVGRLLDADDARSGAPMVAALGAAYWRRQFAEDPGVLERPLTVNGLPVVIVGVVQRGFAGLTMGPGDLWFALEAQARLESDTTVLGPFAGPRDTGIVGRLRSDASPEAAAAELMAVTGALPAPDPGLLDEQEVLRVRPLSDDDTQAPYTVLGALVMLVLLACCANLGNMLLARGIGRESEIATRIAVGASRPRLIRQLMTESLLLAALGAVGGLVVGAVGARLLVVVFAGALDVQLAIDLPVVAAAGALSLVAAVVFGLAPALQLTSRHRRGTRSRQVLVGVQVAVSCVLLIGSGLMTRGVQRQTARASDGAFESLVVVDADLDDANLSGPAVRQVLGGLVDRLLDMPTVEAAAVTANPVFGVSVGRVPGLPAILGMSVDPAYFEVAQLTPMRGRIFETEEPGAAVISEAAARAAFGADDPLGRIWDPRERGTGPTVVGIVEDSRFAALRDGRSIEVYEPLSDASAPDAVVLVRTRGDGRALLESAVAAADGLELEGSPSAYTVQSRVDQLLAHAMAATRVIGTLGTTAAGLAAFGIFGLMALSVRERTKELGVRLVLGARAPSIAVSLLRQYAVPLGAGLLVGTVVTVFGERVMIDQQLGLGLISFDARGYLLGLAGFAATAALAVLVPLRRALRVDPTVVLRRE